MELEIVLADKSDLSLIFSDNPSFSDINELVNDIVLDEEIEADVQACMNDLLESVIQKADKNKRLTRKRSIHKDDWERNKRKRAHQAGLEYVNIRGKKVEPKSIQSKKNCNDNCKFKCSETINKALQEKFS